MRKGNLNSIADVAGVTVGHTTLEERLSKNSAVCTDVSAILPHAGNWFEEKVPAASFVLNGFGLKEEIAIANWLPNSPVPEKPDGSAIIVIATDAPLDSRQLKRLAKRAAIGLGRTGTHIHNGSGDIIIAFSNAERIAHKSANALRQTTLLRDDHPLMADLFKGVIEAIEEAVYQSLLHAETTTGRMGRTIEKGSFPQAF